MNARLIVAALRQLADAFEAQDEPQVGVVVPPAGDLSVADLAQRFRRSPNTVRGWCERGQFQGAYKLFGRDWRVPLAAVEAFERAQRGEVEPGADLSAWRIKHRGARG